MNSSLNESAICPSYGASNGILTPISAEALLKREFPDVAKWMCWNPERDPAGHALSQFPGEGACESGTIGPWNWRRVPCGYCNAGLWGGDIRKRRIGPGWLGMMHLQGPRGQDFMLFSYLSFCGSSTFEYLVSSSDLDMLRRFGDCIARYLRTRRRHKVRVCVHGGPDIQIDARETESIVLPHSFRCDIDEQATTFFSRSKLYRDLAAPYRRGFLFTGPPGTGKTMMIRNLVRRCWNEFRTEAHCLNIRPETDCDDLAMFFQVGNDKAPRLLILEDIESLTCETRVTRAALLAQLDGLDSKKGILLIATANSPEKIDPALIHRPSRFDRVWRFPLPAEDLRTAYLTKAFTTLNASGIAELARMTGGWSFAYLKELRVTAAIIAAGRGSSEVSAVVIREAYGLLRSQFESGQQNLTVRPSHAAVGFGDRIQEPLLNIT